MTQAALQATPPAGAATAEPEARPRHSLYPTRRAVFLFALSVPLALLIISFNDETWRFSLYFPGLALALMAADLSMLLPGRRLDCEVSQPGRLYVGQAGEVRLRLSGRGHSRPLAMTAVLEQHGEADPPAALSATMRDGRLEFALPVMPRRRGRVETLAVWLRWRGPLGLIEIRRRQPVEKRIDVVPNIQGIHEEALRFFAHDAAIGLKSQRLKGEGTEFDTLCDYARGMDNRFIDWKRSARHRKLLCKEFRQERNHQIVLGFDTGHLMLEPVDGLPRLDHAIKAGLLLGWISLRNGDFVGGCGFDAHFRNFIKPGRGMPYFTQVQRFTAGLAYTNEESNFTLGLAELNARLQRRALIILFTEFIDTISAELLLESLQLLVRRHVVVFVTMRDPFLARLQTAAPDSFFNAAEAVLAGDFLRERSIVLERVARLGVHCLDVPAKEVSSAVLNRYLLIKQRGLL